MRHPVRFLQLAVAGILPLLAAALPARAASPGAAAYRDKVPALKSLAARAMKEQHFNAVLLGVTVGGEDLLILAEGESMTGVPATPEMRFRIGNVAIAFVGNLLYQLADEGTLSLDDPIAKWMPELPSAKEVTLLMLLNGTAGYPDFVPMESFQKKFYAEVFATWTPQQLIATAFEQKPPVSPGKGWNYSHASFFILGEAIGRAGGKPLGELLRARVLEPLGLDSTVDTGTPAIPEPVLHAFTKERGPYEDSTFWNPSWTTAPGSVLTSNLRDMLVSARAIGTGRGLKPASFQAMLAPLTVGKGPMTKERYYAQGIVVEHGWLTQTPMFAGYFGKWGYFPAKDIALTVWVTKTPEAEVEGNPCEALFDQAAKILLPDGK